MLDCASYGGHADGEMEQGAPARRGDPGDFATRQGACWALSNMWLLLRTSAAHDFGDFLSWVRTPAGMTLVNTSQAEMARRKAAGESSKVYHAQWLGSFRFALAGHTEIDWPVSPDRSEAITCGGRLKFINLQFDGSGHATACDIDGGRVVFFDPNFGQATFGSERGFRMWFLEKLLPTYHRAFVLGWLRVSTIEGSGFEPA